MSNDKVEKEILIGKRNQITIPKEMLPEGVTQFKAVLREEDGAIILLPRVSIPAHQEYFWTKRWQAGEREASEDIARGRVRRHKDLKSLSDSLGLDD